MPEVIETLSPMFGKLPYFVVNTAVNSVQVIPEPTNPALMMSGNSKYRFRRGDCFTILSVGYFIPEQFVIYSMDETINFNSMPIIKLYSADGMGYVNLTQFGTDGEFKLPLPNAEISVGVFVDPEIAGLSTATFNLYSSFPYLVNSLQISMINVPAALNGVTVKITPFIKVLHNFQLTA